MYNDSQNTRNPSFKFLCYWKILEVPINSRSRKANEWINNILNTNPQIIESNNKLKKRFESGTNIGNYFKDNYRNAIAHISKPPYLSSHNYSHFINVSRACYDMSDFCRIFYAQ